VAGTAVFARRFARRGQPKPRPENVPPIPLDDCADMPAPPRRWGAALPAAFLLACIGARLATLRPARVDPMPLYESASRAYGAGRFADAAEYARHALGQGAAAPLRAELLCLRGESLLRAGQARLAAQSFQDVLAQPEPNPYVAQALFGVMEARTADGDAEHARAARDQLLRDFATSPWARRAMNAP
jgi:TolA-binding protein